MDDVGMRREECYCMGTGDVEEEWNWEGETRFGTVRYGGRKIYLCSMELEVDKRSGDWRRRAKARVQVATES